MYNSSNQMTVKVTNARIYHSGKGTALPPVKSRALWTRLFLLLMRGVGRSIHWREITVDVPRRKLGPAVISHPLLA